MRPEWGNLSRRRLLNRAVRGAVGGAAALSLPIGAKAKTSTSDGCRVAFTNGDSRSDNVFQALKRIEDQIREGLKRKKRVIIKPNMSFT